MLCHEIARELTSVYEIYAYGNNETLYGIFQAMAAIMGSSTYLSAMALVIVAGFVGANRVCIRAETDRLEVARQCHCRIFVSVHTQSDRRYRR